MKLAKLLRMISPFEKIRVFMDKNKYMTITVYEGYASELKKDKGYNIVKNLDIDTVCSGRYGYTNERVNTCIDIYMKGNNI